MLSVNDLKNGLTIEYNNNIYQVLEFQHVKPGKGPAFVRTKLRNLRTKAIQDITFNSNEKVGKAHIDKSSMQFLYKEGANYIFMNMETYDQLEVSEKLLANEAKFLIENMTIQLSTFEGEIVGVILPEKMEMEVVECEPNAKGDTKSGGDKNATVQTGYTLRVPMFIEQGEKIIVNTASGDYVGRA